jgi:YbgC/YbaW family acyl-CoA thioester hydrolase
METKPSTLYTVRFNDCDPLGHLNNSKYIDYFLNAREDHLKESYGIDLKEWASRGLGFVVSRHEIQYIRAVTYNDIICIRSVLFGYGDNYLDVEMSMYDQAKQSLKAILWSRFTRINTRTGRKEDHTAEITEFARQVLVPGIDIEEGMNARIAVLLNKSLQS